MRVNSLLLGAVLLMAVVTGACRKDTGEGTEDAGGGTDASVPTRDGGTDAGGDGENPDSGEDGGPGTSVCNVALQRGCDAGALCLRGLEDGGGQANRCFPGECDLVAQDCPTGNKCTYVRQDNVTRRRCVPAGAAAEGAACESQGTATGEFYDTCARGLYCTDRRASDGSTTFSCQRFCYASSQCAAPRECVDVLGFTGSQELPRVCGEAGPTCDLLTQGCGGTLGCYPSSRTGAVCVAAGSVTDGAACTYSNDCRAGSACVREGAGQVCRRLCRSPSGAPACPSGRCEPLQDFPNVGACVP